MREAILGGEPDRFRRLEIDTKLELGREFYGQLVYLGVGGGRDIGPGAPKQICNIRGPGLIPILRLSDR